MRQGCRPRGLRHFDQINLPWELAGQLDDIARAPLPVVRRVVERREPGRCGIPHIAAVLPLVPSNPLPLRSQLHPSLRTQLRSGCHVLDDAPTRFAPTGACLTGAHLLQHHHAKLLIVLLEAAELGTALGVDLRVKPGGEKRVNLTGLAPPSPTSPLRLDKNLWADAVVMVQPLRSGVALAVPEARVQAAARVGPRSRRHGLSANAAMRAFLRLHLTNGRSPRPRPIASCPNHTG
jgi:hypothetical protein